MNIRDLRLRDNKELFDWEVAYVLWFRHTPDLTEENVRKWYLSTDEIFSYVEASIFYAGWMAHCDSLRKSWEGVKNNEQ